MTNVPEQRLSGALARRIDARGPIGVGLVGAGKFGSMFLSQVPTSPHVAATAIADLDPERARGACRAVGWDEARIEATAFTDDAGALFARDDVEVVVEATGDPQAGIAHALSAIDNGKHVVMVNVEADVLAGPVIAARAAGAGLVYSMAYGDQPALIAELVTWARTCGLSVIAAGKGTKYLPAYHASTPQTVWEHYGISPDEAARAGMNAQMFNSFLDGTKSSIEMAAVANACGLEVPADGLLFPPCGAGRLADVLRPQADGGVLEGKGMVEVVSSLERDGSAVADDLRWGVYVVFEAPNAYTADCFAQYGVRTDGSGRYAALHRPYHLIGLELNVSVVKAAVYGEATGTCTEWRGDVVAVAKRDLEPGERLDGEGGYTVWGKLVPAAASLATGALPIGLAHGPAVRRRIRAGEIVRRDDVGGLADSVANAARAELESRFGGAAPQAARATAAGQ